MKQILAIGGSNSSSSINTIFATYVANQIEGATVTVFDWNTFVLPLYSPDLEKAEGVHALAADFKALIEAADGVVLSLAEYNGLPTTAFKNLWDWTSRLDMKFWNDTPMFLAAASPGGRGGANALRVTKELLPHFGGNVIVDFSLPVFYENFQNGQLENADLNKDLQQKIKLFQEAI